MLPTPRMPVRITSDVRRLMKHMHVETEPLYLSVQPEEYCLPQECFYNVRQKVQREGGRLQMGWAIWKCGRYFIEGELHAVHVQ